MLEGWQARHVQSFGLLDCALATPKYFLLTQTLIDTPARTCVRTRAHVITQDPILRDVGLTVQKGQLVMVVGQVRAV